MTGGKRGQDKEMGNRKEGGKEGEETGDEEERARKMCLWGGGDEV